MDTYQVIEQRSLGERAWQYFRPLVMWPLFLGLFGLGFSVIVGWPFSEAAISGGWGWPMFELGVKFGLMFGFVHWFLKFLWWFFFQR